MESSASSHAAADEKRLAELGYKQSLNRAWSGFSNFAISFTIISVLAGCFTTYGQAWNNGGAVALSLGGAVLCRAVPPLGVADHLRADPARGVLDGRAGLRLSDGGRHLLLGLHPGRPEVGLVHRL